jgi:hypothetical protein
VGSLLTGALPGLAQSATPAPADILNGATVALYGAPCDQLQGEPIRSLGVLQHREVAQDAGPASPAAQVDEGDTVVRLLGEDANGNGTLDEGEDANGNGQLDAGAIAPGDPVPDSALTVTNLTDIWILESELEADEVVSTDEARAVVVQSADGTGQFLACGEVRQQAEPHDNFDQILHVDLGPTADSPLPAIRGYVQPLPAIDVNESTSSGVRVVVFETTSETDPVPS